MRCWLVSVSKCYVLQIIVLIVLIKHIVKYYPVITQVRVINLFTSFTCVHVHVLWKPIIYYYGLCNKVILNCVLYGNRWHILTVDVHVRENHVRILQVERSCSELQSSLEKVDGQWTDKIKPAMVYDEFEVKRIMLICQDCKDFNQWKKWKTLYCHIVAILSKPRISTKHDFTGGRKKLPYFFILMYFLLIIVYYVGKHGS